jgi:hypothetical protein
MLAVCIVGSSTGDYQKTLFYLQNKYGLTGSSMKLSLAKLESEMGTMKLISTFGVPAGIKNATERRILKWKAPYFLIIEYPDSLFDGISYI